jgi:hypothetical protein
LIQIYWFEIKHFRFGKKRKRKVMLIGRMTKAGSLPVLQQPKKEKVFPISITANIGYGKNVIFKIHVTY